MYVVYSDRIGVAIHCAKRFDGMTEPVSWATYRAGLNVQKFESFEIDMMLEQKVLKRARTKWAAPIVFASIKHSIARFWAPYDLRNAATKEHAYFIVRIDKSAEPFRKPWSCTPWKQIADSGMQK